MSDASWRALADEAFLVGMPGKGRVALEILMLLALVFESTSGTVPSISAVVVIATLAMALALVRPWARVHGGVLARAGACLLVVLAVLVPAAVAHPVLADASRHLGVRIGPGLTAPGDPPVLGGIVSVQTVEPGSPADGAIRVGDRIAGVGGSPLDRADPVSDLRGRTHGDALPEDTTVTVLRDGALVEVPVAIPHVRGSRAHLGRGFDAVGDFSQRHLVVAAAVRGALLIGLLLLLVRADGQPLSALGIVREGSLRELLASGWMILGAFAVQIAVAVPVGIVGALAGLMKEEASKRTQALELLAGQGSVGEFVAGAAVAAAFEEVAFRAFLTPRTRSLVRSWPLAVALVSVVFGLGHVYEGALAVIQTAFLGVYFSALLLLRRRLLGPAVAHAAFNTIMFVTMRVVFATGVVDRLKDLLSH